MIAIRTRLAKRLQPEELEPRVLLAGTSFFNDPVLDPLASGGIFNTGSGGILTGSVFSTNGGFSGAGFPTGGGFLTHVGFPLAAVPTPNGSGEAFPAGTELSNATNFPTGLPLSDGIAFPDGAGPSGVGLPDASTVGEVLALGGDPHSEALGGVLSGGFKAPGDSAPDAASGVGQMVIATGANTLANIQPTSGFSSEAGGSGGPVHGDDQSRDEKDREPPGSDATPNVKTGWFDDGAATTRGRDADVAMSIVKDASGQ